MDDFFVMQTADLEARGAWTVHHGTVPDLAGAGNGEGSDDGGGGEGEGEGRGVDGSSLGEEDWHEFNFNVRNLAHLADIAEEEDGDEEDS
jgi:hypothetical protein